MKEVYKYLYAISASCLIAIGSGFVSFSQPVLEYEKKAYESAYKFEAVTSIKLTKSSSCEKAILKKTDCKFTLYMLKTSNSFISLLFVLMKLLFTISALTFVFGAYLHSTVYFEQKKLTKS